MSDVDKLTHEIAQFYQACLGICDSPIFTATSTGVAINARMEKIVECQAQLIDLVGAEEATQITFLAMKRGYQQEGVEKYGAAFPHGN